MLPVALFLSRRDRPEKDPVPSVIDEEYEWVYGRNIPDRNGAQRVRNEPGAKGEAGGKGRNRKFDWHQLSPRHH